MYFLEKLLFGKASWKNFFLRRYLRKKGDLKAKDVDFISYELIEPNKKPSEQMKLMKVGILTK